MSPPPREHRLRPRKEPRQPRAVETRARILAAAKEVIEAHGYAGGTTNRIAEAASLSVGSLYQYFPNKDAILVDLLAEHIGDGAARVHEALQRAMADGAGLDELVRSVVADLLALHREAPVLHQVLVTRTPLTPDLAHDLGGHEDHLVDDLAALLAGHPDVTVHDPKLAARMVATAVNSLVHAQVASRAPAVDDDTFAAEVAAMVLAYLGVPGGTTAGGT